jgi:hypothetical protein
MWIVGAALMLPPKVGFGVVVVEREVSDVDRYLSVVVDEFRDNAQALTGFDLRKRLWKAAIVVCEATGRFEPWHVELATIAHEQGGLKASEVIATVKSARRKAGVA